MFDAVHRWRMRRALDALDDARHEKRQHRLDRLTGTTTPSQD